MDNIFIKRISWIKSGIRNSDEVNCPKRSFQNKNT